VRAHVYHEIPGQYFRIAIGMRAEVTPTTVPVHVRRKTGPHPEPLIAVLIAALEDLCFVRFGTVFIHVLLVGFPALEGHVARHTYGM